MKMSEGEQKTDIDQLTFNNLDFDQRIKVLTQALSDIQVGQKELLQQLKFPSLVTRLEGVEKRQEETVKLLTGLRSELAGISSGMARRDSLMLGSGVVPGLTSLRRDSLVLDSYAGGYARKDSLSMCNDILIQGRGGSIPVMEVEPWEPTFEIKEVVDRLLERQFLLSPWVREKRLRNQLRLVLKDALEAGPKRRSTVTKIVHDAHQLYPVWRNQIREIMFENWEKLQEMEAAKAANIIFAQFKKPRFPDEIESMVLFAEHMVEVGQYLKRKAAERAERAGKTLYTPSRGANSKFWYEVRKKITEVLDLKKGNLDRRRSSNSHSPLDDEDSDDEMGTKTKAIKRQDSVYIEENEQNGILMQKGSSESDFDEKTKLTTHHSSDSY